MRFILTSIVWGRADLRVTARRLIGFSTQKGKLIDARCAGANNVLRAKCHLTAMELSLVLSTNWMTYCCSGTVTRNFMLL